MTEIEAHRIVSLFREEWDKNSKTPNAHALDVAINALEKQIAKKPIDKSNNPHYWHVMACPCCEHTFWNSGQFVHYQPKFCNYCGQKLDWSEEE